jgi:hypothetical protein
MTWVIGRTALLRYYPRLVHLGLPRYAAARIFSHIVNDSKWTLEEAGKDLGVLMEVGEGFRDPLPSENDRALRRVISASASDRGPRTSRIS